jgi:glycosyltransferase involved in cell wall biosynthesis
MKKRRRLISEVKGWGGWVRAKYIRKYLMDEYDFNLLDADEFNEWEEISEDLPKYDLYYFLFHTMLVKKSVKRLLDTDAKVVTIVTGFPTLKNLFYARNRNKERARKTFLKVANKCAAVYANNRKSLEDLRYIYDPRKTGYLPRGVDPNVFYPMTTTFNRKNDENTFTIAYVGKPVPEKGLREIIMPACEQASVRIIFNDRNYENALSPAQMNQFYNKADAYLVASTIDGTPNPALEAASCGKPIVANEIGNMPEFIKDGWNGFLIEGEMTINKYVKKLRWMKRNQLRSFEMGQNARLTVEQDWTWERVVNLHERNAFRRIL